MAIAMMGPGDDIPTELVEGSMVGVYTLEACIEISKSAAEIAKKKHGLFLQPDGLDGLERSPYLSRLSTSIIPGELSRT